ncbi:MAG: HDOD domain-containing protein [Planctomycetota bacterium]
MSSTTQQREQVVERVLGGISHIATLPEITLKIIDLVEDPSSTAQDLHDVISNDPTLSTRILKVVNSSFYGLPGQIGSINRAIVMLGLNAVKNIAIAASLAKLFRGGELTSDFSAKDLWAHSNATAAVAKVIADELKLGLSDEAYLAGLIHDIGIMVELQADRDALIEVIERIETDENGNPTVDMREIEVEAFGASHEDFGRGLCTRWRFPAIFGSVTGFHHEPARAPEAHRTLTNLIAVADRVVAGMGVGFRLDIQDAEPTAEMLEAIGLSAERLESMAEKLDEIVQNLEHSMV